MTRPTTTLRYLICSLPVGALSACGWFADPPTQLESVMTTTIPAMDSDDRQALRDEVLEHLAVEGLQREQLRVVYDKASGRNLLRVVGKQPVAPEVLQKVAQRLAAYGGERNWTAKFVIPEQGTDLTPLLKTEKREFALALDWGRADIEAYVVSFGLGTQFPGMSSSLPQMVQCMLSFQPPTPIPEVEYSYDALNKADVGGAANDPALAPVRERMREMFKNMRWQIEYQLTYEAPMLKHRFTDELQIRDGKLMFPFDTLADSSVSSLPTGGRPIDWGGNAHRQCEDKLRENFPELHKQYAWRAWFKRIVSFAPATFPGAPAR